MPKRSCTEGTGHPSGTPRDGNLDIAPREGMDILATPTAACARTGSVPRERAREHHETVVVETVVACCSAAPKAAPSKLRLRGADPRRAVAHSEHEHERPVTVVRHGLREQVRQVVLSKHFAISYSA